MELFLNVVLALTSVLLIVLILLHRGKGGGLSSMFGGAVSSQLSGSSVVEKNLNRITVIAGLLWAVCIIGLGILIKA
jgi:preprotein translocase subunit SecG